MKIRKNLEKSQDEGFNVWDITTTFCNVLLFCAFVLGAAAVIHELFFNT